jgi:flagellar hook assembly protein FlgD
VRARDVAGRQGAQVTQTQKVDTIAPSGAPVGQTTILTLPATGLPNPVALKYNASNELPGQVRVQVFIRNVLGVVVRRMDAGWVSQGAGQFSWNGRNDANKGVLPGTYTYRVHVTDEAGNTVLSTESKPFIVVLGLLPL